ncbi:MAG: hypothetical protein AAB114_01280 [Chloroflexota bacterium]
MTDEPVADMAIDFIAFCFRRSPVEWPRLYDEMCNVASKRLYKGLGYDELKEAGVDLTFGGMPRMSRIAKEVSKHMSEAALAV